MAHDPREEAPPSGIEEPPGRDPGNARGGPGPHHVLNNPLGEPDPTEWPDPYESRPDPRFTPDGDELAHTPEGAVSTSEPHPDADPKATDRDPPKREDLDE